MPSRIPKKIKQRGPKAINKWFTYNSLCKEDLIYIIMNQKKRKKKRSGSDTSESDSDASESEKTRKKRRRKQKKEDNELLKRVSRLEKLVIIIAEKILLEEQ